MASYVVKVQYQDNLRRVTLAGDELVFSYEQLESRVRDLFQLPSTVQVLFTYVDRDGDVVTMADDQDLKDALVLQSLNPLRVSMAIPKGGNSKIDSQIVLQQANCDDGEIAPNASVVTSSVVDPALDVGLTATSDTSSTAATENELETTTSTDSGVIAPTSNSSEDATRTESSKEAEAATPTKEMDANGNSKEAPATDKNGPGTAGDTEEDEEREVHHGIQCDSCGMFPLVGSRFKSCKQPNYDLCLQCFESAGAKKDEYIHITYGPGRRYRLWHPAFSGRVPLRFCPAFAFRNLDQGLISIRDNSAPRCCSTGVGADANNGVAAAAVDKLEGLDSSRALHDGVQCDECGMAPIEGPRFKSCTRFNYDLCLSCFEKAGNNGQEYTRIAQPTPSHGYPQMRGRMMRLASPYCPQGCMCGRRVWVLNQMVSKQAAVDQSAVEENTTASGSHVNAAGDTVNQAAGEPAAESTLSQMPVADATPADSKKEGTTEELEEDAKVEGIEVAQIPVSSKDVLNLGSTSDAKAVTQVDIGNESTESNPLNKVDQNSVTEQAPEADLSTLEGLLAKLGAMGFTDQTLNTKVLEKNNFDLRRTLDDFCAAEEWDPILGELQEMGFYDANMNRRLMFKNKGSVKNVVKELVQLYKGEKQE